MSSGSMATDKFFGDSRWDNWKKRVLTLMKEKWGLY